MKAGNYARIPSLLVGMSLGLLPVLANVASAQNITAENCSIAVLCQASENESGDGGNATGGDDGNGGHGGNGGFASVHDAANAVASASSSILVGDVTTGDAINPDVSVDADVVTTPALTIVGSVTDVGDDVVTTGGIGTVQRGTTGGSGVAAGESGGDGGNGGNGRDATGGDSGDRDTVQSRSASLP